jgi:uncharacterized protein
MDGMSDVVVYKSPALLDLAEIRRRVAPLLARHGASRAFVIGSYARGVADAWSDLDLVVVMPTDRPFVERPLALTDVLDAVPMAVDLLVYTPEEFERGMTRGFGIFDSVAREGKAILG